MKKVNKYIKESKPQVVTTNASTSKIAAAYNYDEDEYGVVFGGVFRDKKGAEKIEKELRHLGIGLAYLYEDFICDSNEQIEDDAQFVYFIPNQTNDLAYCYNFSKDYVQIIDNKN